MQHRVDLQSARSTVLDQITQQTCSLGVCIVANCRVVPYGGVPHMVDQSEGPDTENELNEQSSPKGCLEEKKACARKAALTGELSAL